MSSASTLNQARDFLLLPSDAPASEVLAAAHERGVEWKTKLDDPKAPARLKDGAARKLRALAPMLPFLETELMIEEAVRAAKDSHIGKNQLMRLCDNIVQKISALPQGEEKGMLLCVVEDIRDSAKGSKTPEGGDEPPDPALPAFKAKLADLRDAIAREGTSKLSLARLLAEANKAMSRLRDQKERVRAEEEIDKLERSAEALFSRSTQPPVDFSKIVADRLGAVGSALDRVDLASAPALLAQVAELLPRLSGDAHTRASAQHSAYVQLHRQLVAAADAELAAEKFFSEKAAAVTVALAQADLPRARALLVETRASAAEIRDSAVRAATDTKLAALEAQIQIRERAVLDENTKQKVCDDLLKQVSSLAEKRDLAGALKAMGQARVAAVALVSQPARESALTEIETLAARLKVLNQPEPLPPPCQLLQLTPREGTLVTGYVPVPLRLVARPRLVIGRYSSEGANRADFQVPLAEKRVSRAHVILTKQGEEIMIQDGDEGKKSSNGSKLDDEILPPAPVPASFGLERVISLGGIFSLTAQHLPTAAPGGPPQSGSTTQGADGKTVIVNAVTGCMKFGAKTEEHLPVQTVWIFTDASLGSAPSNALSLPHSGLAENHVLLHFWQGHFWIETLCSGNAVRLSERVLVKGESSILRTGDILHLGQLAFDVNALD